MFTIPEAFNNIKIPEMNDKLKCELLDKYFNLNGMVKAYIEGKLYNEEVYEVLYPYICRMIYDSINSSNGDRVESFENTLLIFEYFVYMQYLPGVPSMSMMASASHEYDYIREVYKLAKLYIDYCIL